MCIANKLKKNNKYIFISCRPQKPSVLGHKSGLKRDDRPSNHHADARSPGQPTPPFIPDRACERSWAVRISAPRSRGCSLPCSTAQSRTRSLRSIPLPAHLQFHPAPEKSLHARSNLKLLCMPKTCRFQPNSYASDTLSAWQTWSGFVAWLLRKKSASLLFCRGAAVAAWLDHTWYARIPQAMWLL